MMITLSLVAYFLVDINLHLFGMHRIIRIKAKVLLHAPLFLHWLNRMILQPIIEQLPIPPYCGFLAHLELLEIRQLLIQLACEYPELL